MIFDIEKARITFDNVLVVPVSEEQTDGIMAPTQYADKPEMGEVIALGDKTGLNLKKGDIVIYQKYSAIKFKFSGKDYYIVKSDDIVAY